jgi:large subunit ribosomal protein L29
MIEMTEIRQLSDADLADRIEVERESLAKLRFNHTVAGLESTTALKYKKRDVARLLTEANTRNKANS